MADMSALEALFLAGKGLNVFSVLFATGRLPRDLEPYTLCMNLLLTR
jgi:hypothetical protein